MGIDHDAIKAAFREWRGPTEEGDSVGHVVFGAGYLAGQRALTARVAELEAECLEQARYNGMGSEREARLMARVAELEKDAARYRWLRENNIVANIRFHYATGESPFIYAEVLDESIDAALLAKGAEK